MNYHALFDSSSEDDDIAFEMMYEHYQNEYEDEEEEVFHTRNAKPNRDRAAGHNRLYNDYFAPNCVYNDYDFERRFRMNRNTLLRITSALEERYVYFQTRYDARKVRGFTALQKCTAAVRCMATGNAPDALDDYLRMSERTARECMNHFCAGVCELFGPIYLRKPNMHDVQNLYAWHEEKHGFPGMLGSIDCTHWDWRNCPQSHRVQHTNGYHGTPSLILEVVASQDTWIWHAYFGTPGSLNDVNVLDQSPIFNDMLSGKFPDSPFTVRGHYYKYGYYLTDGIYPRHATLVKAYQHQTNKRERFFTKRQEAARKDVERAFGIMKAKWHVVDQAARPYELDVLRPVMYACCILHNMVIEQENRHISPYVYNAPQPPLYIPGTNDYLERVVEIQSVDTHELLKDDLARMFYSRATPAEVAAVSDIDDYEDAPEDVDSE